LLTRSGCTQIADTAAYAQQQAQAVLGGAKSHGQDASNQVSLRVCFAMHLAAADATCQASKAADNASKEASKVTDQASKDGQQTAEEAQKSLANLIQQGRELAANVLNQSNE
jgi:hypothetical protein